MKKTARKEYQNPKFKWIEFEMGDILTDSNDVSSEEETGKEYWTEKF